MRGGDMWSELGVGNTLDVLDLESSEVGTGLFTFNLTEAIYYAKNEGRRKSDPKCCPPGWVLGPNWL